MQRRSLAVRGIVQGVGFRPFVYGLAARLSLKGTTGSINGVPRLADRLFSDPPARPPAATAQLTLIDAKSKAKHFVMKA